MSTLQRAAALLLLAITVATTLAFGQELPPPPRDTDPRAAGDPRAPIMNAAREATLERRPEDTRRHLDNALWFQPTAKAVLTERLGATTDPDEARFYLYLLTSAAVDARGGLDRAIRDLIPDDDPALESIAAARAAAVDELVTQLGRGGSRSRQVGAGIVNRHLADLAHDVLRRSPPLWSSGRAAINGAREPTRNAHTPVVAALKKLLRESSSGPRLSMAIRVARCLKGLGHQAEFKDLQGPEPSGMSGVQQTADDALARARAELAAATAPLTVDAMYEFDLEQRLAFTREHDTFDHPGVAVSPGGLYRVETICGFETLLGAASTVEDHHHRLVNWYGQDPFAGRPGVVRVVPEASGLESEGAPYFWVGGFQQGDVTTLRFNASDIASLGRGLTHELTHRFDGAIYPGMPSWLAEGRAVYTGAAYAFTSDDRFVDDHCSFGTMESAMRKGYGGQSKLEELIAGTIDEYRDNYVAGYALFVYLRSWEDQGRRPFAPRLDAYMKDIAKGRSKPVAWFESCFADGGDGRPKGMKAFADGFGRFLSGFYWLDRKPWTKRYRESLDSEPSPLIYDAPTWGFRRNRAEPWFGEQQAAIAGALLLEAGRTKEAGQAWSWALEVDEWSGRTATQLADVLDVLKEREAAWVLRAENHRRRPATYEDPGAWPMLRSLPKTTRLLDALAQAATAYRDASLPRLAASLAAEHDELAVRVGRATIAVADVAPFEDPSRYAGALGFIEDGLTDYEEYRVEGLWYDDGEGGLHVGREKPRDQTGQVDRSAHQRHAFARSVEWIPAGRYRVTTRVHFTTSFVSGAMILGHTRRDRNLRLSFGAGDYMYSIGQKDDAAELDAVSVSLTGIRDGEAPWSGQEAARRVAFEQPRTSFEIELLVDGPLVLAKVDGQEVGAYHTTDGQPIEGCIGFASSFGAFRAERPTITPLHRSYRCGVVDPACAGLSLNAGTMDVTRLRNRSVSGFPVSPRGTVVLWVPWPAEQEDWELEQGEQPFDLERTAYIAKRATRAAGDLLWKYGFDPALYIAVPSVLGEKERRGFSDADTTWRVLVHERRGSFVASEDDSPGEIPFLLFIDSTSVLRSVSSYFPGVESMPNDLLYWLSVYRERK